MRYVVTELEGFATRDGSGMMRSDDARRRLREWANADTVSSRLAAPTYRNPGELRDDLLVLLDATEPQKPRHEWDDVRWQEHDGEYEASCWCGWTDTAWSHDAAEESLRTHLKENGVTVE